MSKYHYKHYLNRAFWNSLFAVLSAIVLVLIILYGWKGLQVVLNQIGITDVIDTEDEVEEDRLEILESLRGQDDVSVEEKHRILEALRPPEDSPLTEEERISILRTLQQ